MSCETQYKDATVLFLEQIDVIKRWIQKYNDDMTFVTSAQGNKNIILAFYNTDTIDRVNNNVYGISRLPVPNNVIQKEI